MWKLLSLESGDAGEPSCALSRAGVAHALPLSSLSLSLSSGKPSLARLLAARDMSPRPWPLRGGELSELGLVEIANGVSPIPVELQLWPARRPCRNFYGTVQQNPTPAPIPSDASGDAAASGAAAARQPRRARDAHAAHRAHERRARIPRPRSSLAVAPLHTSHYTHNGPVARAGGCTGDPGARASCPALPKVDRWPAPPLS